MDLNQLKTFVTVAQTASLTRAAGLLFLSQPAISAHIKALENEYNVKLFTRTPRGMELTTAGVALRDEAQQALEAAKRFEHKAKALNEVMVCALGTIAVPVILNLPGVLGHLRQRYSNINLTIRQNISGYIINDVIAGELDAGFVIGKINHPGLEVIVISPVTLCIVGPWAWRQRLQQAQWQDMVSFPWISTPEQCSYSVISSEFFASNNITVSPVMVADQEKTLGELVCMEIGLTLMREDLALAGQQEQKFYIWPQEKTVSQLCFIYSKIRHTSPIITALTDAVREVWHIAE